MVSRFEQNQIRTSNPKDDGYTVANADSAKDLEEDLNYIRSDLKQIKGTPDWKGTPATDLANASTVDVINDLSDASTISVVGLSSPPIHQYLFNSGATTAPDSGSIGDLPLTVLNGTPDIVAGRSGTGQENAMFFNSASNEAIASAVTMPKRFLDDFSVAALIKPTDLDGANNTIISINGAGGVDGFCMWLKYDADLNFVPRVNDQTPTTPIDLEATATGLTDGNWHNVFITYDKSTGTLLARVDDGAGGKTASASFAAGETQIRQNHGALQVGASEPTYGHAATIAVHSVAIWDRKLSTAEMDSIYTNTSIEDLYADPPALTGNEPLLYNPTEATFVPGKLRIGDLDKTDLDTPVLGQIPRYDGINWVGADHGNLPAELTLSDQTPPASPGSGKGELFKLTGNRNLFWKPDNEVDSERVTNQSTLDDIGGVATNIVSSRPRHFFKFNESAFPTAADSGTQSAYDLSVKSGTVTSSEGYPNFGEPSSAALFDGVNGTYLKGGTSYPLDMTDDFSIVALVRSNNLAKNATIVSLADDGSNEVFVFYQTSSGRLNSLIWDEPTRAIQFAGNTAATALTADTWHYCFLTYDKSTGTLTTRVDDGTEVTGTYGADRQVFQHSTAVLHVGAREFSSTYAFSGDIELVGIYNTLLSTADMDAIYDNGIQEQEDLVKSSPNTLAANHAILWDTEASAFVNQALELSDNSDVFDLGSVGITYAPIHQYLFNEASFASGAADTGRIGGETLNQVSTPDPSTGLSGFGQGKAADFISTGAEGFESQNVYPTDFENDFAIAVLLNIDILQQTGIVTLEDTGGDLRTFALFFNPSGDLSFRCKDSTGTLTKTAVVTGGISTGSWQWVFASYKRSTGTLTARVDNGTPATDTFGSDTQVSQAPAAKLGVGFFQPAPSWYIDGKIHGIWIWNQELSTADMDTLVSNTTEENLYPNGLSLQDKQVLKYSDVTSGFSNLPLRLDDNADVNAPSAAADQELRLVGGIWTPVDGPQTTLRLKDQTTVPAAPGSGLADLFKKTGSPDPWWVADTEIPVNLARPTSVGHVRDVSILKMSAKPVNQWRFNESSVSTVTDDGVDSDHNLDVGTVVGSLSVVTDGYPNFDEPSRALNFPGTAGNRITGGSAFANKITESFSISALIRLDTVGKSHMIIELNDDATDRTFQFSVSSGNKLGLSIWDAATQTRKDIFSTNSLSVDTWHWCFGRYDYATGDMFVRLDGDTTDTLDAYSNNTQLFQHTTAVMRVGSHVGGASDFEGSIDTIWFYDVALTDTDWTNAYESGEQAEENFVKSDPSAKTDKSALLYDSSTSTFLNRPIVKADVSDYDALANVVEDTTPQLGGNLDLNGFGVVSSIEVSEDVSVGDTLYLDPDDFTKAIKGGTPWEGHNTGRITVANGGSSAPRMLNAVKISASHAVWCWRQDDGSAGGQVVVQAVKYNTTTKEPSAVGTMFVVSTNGTASTSEPDIVKISSTKVLVVWHDYDATPANQHLKSRVVEFTGGDLVTGQLNGSETSIEATEIQYFFGAMGDFSDSTRGVVSFKQVADTHYRGRVIHFSTHAEATITVNGDPDLGEVITIDSAGDNDSITEGVDWTRATSDNNLNASRIASAWNSVHSDTYYAESSANVVTIKHRTPESGPDGKAISFSSGTNLSKTDFTGGAAGTDVLDIGVDLNLNLETGYGLDHGVAQTDISTATLNRYVFHARFNGTDMKSSVESFKISGWDALNNRPGTTYTDPYSTSFDDSPRQDRRNTMKMMHRLGSSESILLQQFGRYTVQIYKSTPRLSSDAVTAEEPTNMFGGENALSSGYDRYIVVVDENHVLYSHRGLLGDSSAFETTRGPHGVMLQRWGGEWRPLTAGYLTDGETNISFPGAMVKMDTNWIAAVRNTGTTQYYYSIFTKAPRVYLGRATAAATSGNPVVYAAPGGITDIDSGLNIGELVFEQADGSVSTVRNFKPIGFALTASKVQMFTDDIKHVNSVGGS